MRVKGGVNLDGIHYLLVWAAAVYDYTRQALGLGEGTVTGGRESADPIGPARVAGSLHPNGYALDLRTTDIPAYRLPQFYQALRRNLGPQFDVVEEFDHAHVELQVRTVA